MSRRPTMRDVAAAAGVSVKTVSRVVNDEAAVRDVVADRVRCAIAALGYRPDNRAQLLRRRGTASSTIGFVPLDISNPFFSAIYRGLEDVAWAHGYVVVAGSSDGTRERGEAILKRLIGARVDGLVVVPAGDDHTLLAEEVGRGTPVVLLDLEVDDVTGIDLVRSDHRGGARLAVRHLIAHGHRDIAFLGDVPSIFSARERYRGYVDAMRAARIKRRPEWTVHGLDTAAAAATVRGLFAPGVDAPSALFTAQNFVTMGAVHGLHALGLHGVVALAAFDDVDMADVVEPALTVVPQKPTDLGRQAGELLLDRIRGHRGPARHVILRNELIVRGSGEIPPAARKRDEVARRQA
jgi:LacI family transcriptional regulator, galactose operon repressor